MKSYKKLNQKAQNLEITTFTMGIRHKIVLICKNHTQIVLKEKNTDFCKLALFWA